MPQYIIKPSPDVDFYVEWSTVIDNFTDFGTREEMSYDDEQGLRLDRADKYGTSSYVGSNAWGSKWADTIHSCGGSINRSDLKEFCETWDEELDWDNPVTSKIIARCEDNFDLDEEEFSYLLSQ